MTEKPTRANLRKMLADLYPEVDDSQRVVADAGLDSTYITFKNKAINNWFNILQEAEKHNKVQAIIKVARGNYPEESKELDRIYAEMLQSISLSSEEEPGHSYEEMLQSPEQVRPYLLPNLYSDLTLRPDLEISQKCNDHLGSLLETVQTYCAVPILEEAQFAPRNVQGQWREATLLFADISGFTAMSEQLSARGRAGAEEITRIVNEYFAKMTDILHQNGGSLIKFGGDALLGMFAGQAQDTARYAVQAALDMQRAMAQFADTDTTVGQFNLQMKVGLHTGKVFTAHVGTASQMEYWVTGNDVNLTASVEEAARKGQVVISEATRQHLTGWVDTTLLTTEDSGQPTFYAVPVTQSYNRLKSRPVSKDFPIPRDISVLTQRLDILTPYLPNGLLPRLVYHSPRSRRVKSEHRLVAVLFINVIGFSELAAALNPDQADVLTETMQDYFSTIQSIVEAHGGAVNKTDLYSTGDKLLAVFGAPVAHEDDVDQAARAAVALQAVMGQVNQRLADRCPQVMVRLQQRIGLSTGYVFSGNVGSKVRQEYTIMGDEVNLAARLMSAARWDDILVSDHAFYLLEPFGEFDFFGELELKGKQEPVSTYRLSRMGVTQRPKPPFVDRQLEYQSLQDTLEYLLNGQGQIILLTGEPGIGKTRLLSELRPDAESKNVLWLTGQCREYQTMYHLVAGLLRDYLKLETVKDPDTQRQVLAQAIERLFGAEQVDRMGPFLALVLDLPLTADWKERVGVLTKPVDFSDDRLSSRLAGEMTTFLERLIQDQPVAVICENLHWLDSGSAEILLKIMDVVERAPILLGLTLRSGQYQAPRNVLGAATQFDGYKQLRLKSLNAEDTSQLVTAILGPSVGSEFQARVYERSQGNPMFAAEIAHARAVTTRERAIPVKVEKIIASRVDEMPERLRETIKVAAIIGMQFTVTELEYVLSKPRQDILSDLGELRARRLISNVDIKQKRFAFANPLTWEVIYNCHDQPSLFTAHSKLGQYWTGQANPQKAAYHYLQGEMWEQALVQSEQAADEHRETYAYAEALRLYEQALKAAEELRDLNARTRLYHRVGEVYFEVGNYEQAIKAHQRELGLLLQQSATPSEQAAVHWALGRVYDRWSKFELALDELGHGLKLVGQGDSVTRAQLLNARCSVLRDVGKLEEAKRDGLQALQIARDLGARHEEATACNCLGVVYGMLIDIEQALKYHKDSLTIRRELGLTYDVTQSLVNLGVGSGMLSYFKRAEEKSDEADRLLDEAEAYLQEALEIRERIDDRYGLGSVYHNLGRVDLERERLEAAESNFSHALDLWGQVDYPKGVAFAHNDLGGEVYAAQERWDEARIHLEQSAQIYKSIGANTYLWGNYMSLANVYRNLDRLQDALTAAQKALEWALNPKQEQKAKDLLQKIRQTGKADGE